MPQVESPFFKVEINLEFSIFEAWCRVETITVDFDSREFTIECCAQLFECPGGHFEVKFASVDHGSINLKINNLKDGVPESQNICQ